MTDLKVTCLSIDCPERKGGICWAADPNSKQYKEVQAEFEKAKPQLLADYIYENTVDPDPEISEALNKFFWER